ncbi:branched-chain amino acid ABC transporter permease [Demequina capsici]|uniref:Branched-chain amino acid ABC transporter permease n=1 Tax=Demequina capsici TaxID=3075620 RepID=A0AA96FD04_9MICO|nr:MULTISPECIES: branched-chain amino acid ABC transporter permease [unclassified Demequina]WNM25940.1 branched-chain amino acid ABC transporter permease [Demequina sp. OYTSA14]WNM26045.1 branched-chain amino acid ABC transporter permease [Demequina sp. PMTSA13]
MDFAGLLTDATREMFAPTTAAFALAAIGLNFHFGLTGLLNMGHAGFMLLGMYGYAITVREGGSMWLGILVAMVLAMLFGLLLGWPTLKLRGDYLAIVTIAAAEFVRFLGRSSVMKNITGGSTGIRGSDYKAPFEALSPFPDKQITIGLWTLHGSSSTSWWLVVVSWSMVAIFAWLFWMLARSPWGRVLKGVREDEDAVRSLGKNVYAYKMQALVIGGVIGALGGILWSFGNAVSPDSMGRPTTFWIWTLLLLGGAATVFGPILGSVLFWTALVLVKGLAAMFIPETLMTATQREPFALILVGVALMLLVIFRPQGILGNRRELAING